MDTRFLRTTLTLLALVACAVPAAAAWNAFDGGSAAAPRVETRDTATGRTVVDVTLPGIETATVTIDGRPHTKVVLPGHVQLLERGAPQLPYITTSLVIPGQGTPTVRVLETSYREIPVDPIVPGRGAILRTVDPSTVPYTFGPAYQGGVFPAEPVRVGEPYIVRDLRGVNVRLFPARWDADRGVLRVLERVTYEVTTRGQGGVNVQTRRSTGIQPVFEPLYAEKFANFARGLKYEINAAEGPMLVIADDAFAGAMQPFVDWKRQRGIPVELVTTSSVGGTTGGIQTAIQQRYDSPAGLAYVVLVGDGQQVPHYSGAYEGADDDTRYVRLEGDDPYPDALISRISAQNASEVTTQVAKIVAYERDVTADAADWTHRGTGIASNEGYPSDAERMDWLRDDLLGYTYTDVDRIYQGQGGSGSQISAAVNEGRSLINYMGHGSGTSWSSVFYTNGDVAALTNTTWPWIIDVACLNGGISAIAESFAEAWMRAGGPAEPHGAVGIYASSTSTPWVPPTVMQAEAVDLLVAETSHVIGVLTQAGIMEVLDEYGTTGTGLQLVEQYNLFGDCSLVVRSDTPQTLDVAHQPVVPLMAPSFDVDAGAPGVRVALTGSDGVIHGVGVTDETGTVELQLTEPVDSVGTVHLTASGYNLQTYQVELQAVVPADIAFSPAEIPVGETTAVTVTVTDPDDGAGLADVDVEISGFGVETTSAVTDAGGQVTLSVTPEFGETLQVRGRELGADYDLFTEGLPVTGAAPFGDAQISAAVPSIGMDGTLTPHLEGEVRVQTRQMDYAVEVHGAGVDTVQAVDSGNVTVLVTPTELAPVTATLTRTGAQVVQQTLEVVEAFGTLAGSVVDGDDGEAAVGSARVLGFPAGADPEDPPLFDVTTAADGTWSAPEELAVGYYDLSVEKFGYEPYTETYFLLYGANDHQITVNQAPSGVITGVLTGADDGAPLDGTVRVYRSDNDQLYDEVTTDPATGEYTTGALPYFEYRVVVRAYRRVPVTEMVAVTEASITRDYALEPTEGDILILDDDSARRSQSVPAKYAEDGRLLAAAYTRPATNAASDLAADLEELGYAVTLEPAASSDATFWPDYDLLICSSGDKTTTLTDDGLRADLTSFVAGGGKLLVEGGEVAYDMQYTDATFMRDVLHVDDWNGDSSGDLAVADAAHPVMSVPNPIEGSIDNSYSGYGDADRVDVTSSGHVAGNWTEYSADASVITHDGDDEPADGDFVFFLFNYSAMGTGRVELLHNAVSWLLANPLDPTPVEDRPTVPSVLSLDRNYPNPFNPQTVIRFSLPAAEDAELAVYDVRGKRVRTLVRDVLPAGEHSVTWQGRDDHGRSVASGTYFYRLTTDGESLVRKMLLIK